MSNTNRFSLAMRYAYDKFCDLSPRPDPSARPHRLPQHLLYFLPLPQGHGSLRPTFVAGVGAAAGVSRAFTKGTT